MKKLSVVAAGVAVLSLCACTEANEFVPSTNGNTKLITEIKVSSNASALGSRTVFDPGYNESGEPTGSFGVVTWEQGDDELHFFQEDNSGVHKTFVCGTDATGPSTDYDWNSFEAKNKNSDGLAVKESYYAYYFPYYKYFDNDDVLHVLKDDAVTLKTVDCTNFYLDNRIGANGGMLKEFMHNYDVLQSTNGQDGTFGFVTATNPMGYIYMDHSFALITVNLECDQEASNYGMGNFSGYASLPSFYQAEIKGLHFEDSQSKCANSFANSYQIDSDGSLKFNYADYNSESQTTISSIYNSDVYYYLADSKSGVTIADINYNDGEVKNKLSFYFLVRQRSDSEMNRIVFYIDNEANHDPNHKNSKDKSIIINLKSAYTFEPGKSYTFDFKVDYTKGIEELVSYQERQTNNYNIAYWEDNKAEVLKLAKYPTNMDIAKVEYGTR